ncbi:hypothetical protein LCGC14_1619490 [marine sediment metagenome]|uniref:Tex-like protein N-terminal domain-containing protein n=1 Tax=marine sediment metagenome TaxID=412755 RepID=A0A0F9ISV7_9ZZZZ
MDFNFLFSPDTIITSISTNLNISSQQIGATIKLLEEDNSIPFIARYRKDITNNLNEIQLRDIKHEWDYLNSLNDLKKHVYGSIDEQKVAAGDEACPIIVVCHTAQVPDSLGVYGNQVGQSS